MELNFNFIDENIDNEEMYIYTQKITKLSKSEIDANVRFKEKYDEIGLKGGIFDWSEIIITAMNSGAIIAFLNIIKQVFSKKPSVTIEIENEQGSKIKLNMQDLNKKDMQYIVEELKEILGI